MRSDSEEWDDCGYAIAAESIASKPLGQQVHRYIAVDGFKSGLITVPTDPTNHKCTVGDLNIIIQPPVPETKVLPYEAEDKPLLPPSFLLAAQNRMSYDGVLSAQARIQYALPYFFYGAQMFPTVLLGSLGSAGSVRNMTANMTTAVVHGFRRHAIRGRSYPAASRSDDPEDCIVGMLAFSVPDDAREPLDRFQGGTSETCETKARFELSDGRTCFINCKMYITRDTAESLLLPLLEQKWQVSDLMHDEWHIKNLATRTAQEESLKVALVGE